jgi:GNAT superfamily N-acetyltransferase
MPNDLLIRLAEATDADAIAHLINAAFRPARFFTDEDRTNPEEVRSLMTKGKFLLAHDAGALAGCVLVELRGDRGYFGLLSVDPQRQRSGFGRDLVAAAEDYCRTTGCRAMDLRFVNLRKELPGYYRRLGYHETGTEPFTAAVPTTEPCHFIVMSKPLV